MKRRRKSQPKRNSLGSLGDILANPKIIKVIGTLSHILEKWKYQRRSKKIREDEENEGGKKERDEEGRK